MVNGFCWYFYGGEEVHFKCRENICTSHNLNSLKSALKKIFIYFRCVITAETTNKYLCTVGFSFKTVPKNEPVCFCTG